MHIAFILVEEKVFRAIEAREERERLSAGSEVKIANWHTERWQGSPDAYSLRRSGVIKQRNNTP